MGTRTKRLRQLIDLQQKLKAIHETRHAGFLREAAAADAEAEDLARRSQEASPLADLFPGLYARRVARALERKAEMTALAGKEARKIAAEEARTDVVRRNYREAVRQEERSGAEKEILEILSRPTPAK
ncbi:MAG: hypothetical protein F9K19_16880 [Rhizobiaceae bacterium]|nr:MAG: hypothetical protein F9K19_16880 [Rhizobiaceae bacterium]CAG0966608.1 hypothetical protein RHIZO_00995 [Rhizobiaceae bacterium]